MKALIRTTSGFYCSTVFAYYESKWKSSVVVLNESNSQLIMIPCNYVSKGRIRRDVFCYDESRENWCKNGKWCGLDFIVHDKNILRYIKKGIDIPSEILMKSKALQTTETFDGWIEIYTDEDIKKLMNLSLSFHDGYINKVEYSANDVCVTFKCWSCLITVKFIDVIESDTGKEDSWENNCIFEATMFFKNENIEWHVDSFCFEEYDQACYFIAKGVHYKIELENTF